jgi:hypothetical protein
MKRWCLSNMLWCLLHRTVSQWPLRLRSNDELADFLTQGTALSTETMTMVAVMMPAATTVGCWMRMFRTMSIIL